LIQAYSGGVHKSQYADFVLEDCLNLIAFLPRLASIIYRNTYHDGKVADHDDTVDYSKNFAQMLGYKDNKVRSLCFALIAVIFWIFFGFFLPKISV
jgi:citrate synthase